MSTTTVSTYKAQANLQAFGEALEVEELSFNEHGFTAFEFEAFDVFVVWAEGDSAFTFTAALNLDISALDDASKLCLHELLLSKNHLTCGVSRSTIGLRGQEDITLSSCCNFSEPFDAQAMAQEFNWLLEDAKTLHQELKEKIRAGFPQSKESDQADEPDISLRA